MDFSRQCKVHPDKFCFICGEYMLVKDRKTITPLVEETYISYFGRDLENRNQPWTPNFACKSCYDNLRQWKIGKRPSMPFSQPTLWNTPMNHPTDCYFCNTNIVGYNKQKKDSVMYPDVASVVKPVPHDEHNPIPSTSLNSTSVNGGKLAITVVLKYQSYQRMHYNTGTQGRI